MLQHLHKISLRSSLQGGEEWPARCRSPDVDQRQQMSNRSFDENSHQLFFLNNLEDILVALQDPGRKFCIESKAKNKMNIFSWK